MLLPTELLTLVFLATTCTAFPQGGELTNATTPSTEPTPTPVDPDWNKPADINISPEDDPCATAVCGPMWIIPELPSAPGWETGPPGLATPSMPVERPPEVLTTRKPSIVDIQTNTAPRPSPSGGGRSGGSGSGNGNGNGNGPVNNPPPPVIATGSYSVVLPSSPSTPTQGASENVLLQDIVSRLGDSQVQQQAQPQPSQPVAPRPGGATETPVRMEQITPGPKAQSVGAGSNSQATLAPGGILTAGSATLTLTPGLSTTVGSGTDATYIGITTDSTGHTLITVSSSGTAVTARVTDAPATVTLPKSGFEASITQAARPADMKTSNAGNAAATTSSKGAAGDRRGEMGWRLHAVVGIVGVARALW